MYFHCCNASVENFYDFSHITLISAVAFSCAVLVG